MTGTPIENHLLDIWNLFDFTMPNYLGTQKEFDDTVRSDNLSYLKQKIKPFVLRREKIDVLDALPEKTETIITCPLSPEQEELYKTVLQATKQGIKTSTGQKQRMHVLTSLLKLRQICLYPGIIDEFKHLSIPSAKFDFIRDKCKVLIEEGHKVVLFTQFTKMLDVLDNWCQSESIYYERIDGSVSGKQRQERVNTFQETSKPGLFLISLKAGGVGINLTSADYVIHLDPWWNPAVESQATDRVHRMGQTNKVFVYKLIAKGSVEEKILQLQQEKQALLADLIDIDSLDSQKINLKEVESLLFAT